MSLILKCDLDMVKVSHQTKNEDSMSRYSKLIACTDRQYENITFPHTRAVTIKGFVDGQLKIVSFVLNRAFVIDHHRTGESMINLVGMEFRTSAS